MPFIMHLSSALDLPVLASEGNKGLMKTFFIRELFKFHKKIYSVRDLNSFEIKFI
jgi:hypothetical protein